MKTIRKLCTVLCVICFILLLVGCSRNPNSGNETGSDSSATEPAGKPSDGSIELPMIPA